MNCGANSQKRVKMGANGRKLPTDLGNNHLPKTILCPEFVTIGPQKIILVIWILKCDMMSYVQLKLKGRLGHGEGLD